MTQQLEQQDPGARTATAFHPGRSPAVASIVTYRFGTDAEATRPDRVMRIPAAAVLLQRRGRLFARNPAGTDVPLPAVALLGPSSLGQIWSTAPDTEFSLVNLALGACQRLFGADPREIENTVESLQSHPMSVAMLERLNGDSTRLHGYLCSSLGAAEGEGMAELTRARAVLTAIAEGSCGDRVAAYAGHFGVTVKTLQRIVRAAVGLTPKQVLSIERIRRLVVLTLGGWSRSLADLAQAAGFFDQSHLRQELIKHDFGCAADHLEGAHIVVQR